MRQLIFAISMVHMLFCAAFGTLILSYLSPEKLAPTRLNWLADPSGVLFGVAAVAVAAVIPLALILAIDGISEKEGRVAATKEISEKYFLIKK